MDHIDQEIRNETQQLKVAQVRLARLMGRYLNGHVMGMMLDAEGKIIDSEHITSLWAGTDKFDAWFRDLYGPEFLEEDEDS
jgi:hypothetical protein